MTKTSKQPSVGISMIPIITVVALFTFTVGTFGGDALGGASQMALLLATAVCVAIGMLLYGRTWQEYEGAIVKNIAGVAPAMIILLIIGALSGTWMVSGVVPTLIYYGLEIINPQFFLVSSCLICVLVSLMTGSSWTTIATIGIALMGIGKALGYSEGCVAGAIISGSYFGDKVSPLSETTVLASSVTGTPLFRHIRYMMITTVPSLLISLALFTILGLNAGMQAAGQHEAFSRSLKETFLISPWLLTVPLATGVLIARKVPSVITLFVSVMMACAAATIAQPHLIYNIAGEASMAKGLLITCYGATGVPTGNAMLTQLVATRGMEGMLSTVWLIICAMCFGGAMTAGGMLHGITRAFAGPVRGRLSMVSSTVGSGLFLNLTTADQYISIILTGKVFKDIYAHNGYESRLLSRTTEDAVTVTSVLIPWNSCGLTQSTVLGVATLTYLPYCFFNILSPLMSIIVAAIGYKVRCHKGESAQQCMARTTAA